MLSYPEAIQWLFEQFPSYQNIGASAYKPGLENVRKLADYFDNPQNELKFVHVAGTNGKGTTCNVMASILQEAGYNIGLFTSPHLVEFEERIRVNGNKIDKESVVQFVEKIQAATFDFQPSFFEITLLMALLHFKDSQCDLCILETGLGGRLDATNIISPLLSVITNISLEHQNFLGDTRSLIAGEKAGIIKPNIDVVIGEKDPETKPIFEELAQRNNSNIHWVDEKSLDLTPLNLGSTGLFEENIRTVLTALKQIEQMFPIRQEHIVRGIEKLTINTGFYGRLQVISQQPLTIFDVSHNASGMRRTLDWIKQTYPEKKLQIVFGASSDKDLNALFPLFIEYQPVFLTEFSGSRAAKLVDLESMALKYGLNYVSFDNPTAALAFAQKNSSENQLILVVGSFFLLSDLLKIS